MTLLSGGEEGGLFKIPFSSYPCHGPSKSSCFRRMGSDESLTGSGTSDFKYRYKKNDDLFWLHDPTFVNEDV